MFYVLVLLTQLSLTCIKNKQNPMSFKKKVSLSYVFVCDVTSDFDHVHYVRLNPVLFLTICIFSPFKN